MVSPFDKAGLPNYKDEKGWNAPLPFTAMPMPGATAFHGGESGKAIVIKPRSSLKIDFLSPEFIQQMEKLGKTPMKRMSTKPIEFMIYNDASRPPHETETEEQFYAKYVEYGFHYKEDGQIRFKEGIHLWNQVRKYLKRRLVTHYKAMSKVYNRKSVTMAMREAIEETTLKLISITPVDTNLMKNSWKYLQIQ